MYADYLRVLMEDADLLLLSSLSAFWIGKSMILKGGQMDLDYLALPLHASWIDGPVDTS